MRVGESISITHYSERKIREDAMKKKREMKIKKDDLFILTHGCYSDYSLITVCKALEDIDILFLKEEYLSTNPEQRGRHSFSDYEFTKWLVVDKRMAEEVHCLEWHLGDYADGDFSLE